MLVFGKRIIWEQLMIQHRTKNNRLSENKLALFYIWVTLLYIWAAQCEKCVFGHMRIVTTQIIWRIRAVWSGPSLSTTRIIGYYIMYEWRAKAWMILCACAGWCESAHFTHAPRHLFAWHGPFFWRHWLLDTPLQEILKSIFWKK